MDLGLKNKCVLISGASKGLGFAIASQFAVEGANVSICARKEDEVSLAADTIRKQTGVKVLPFKVDVTREDDIQNWVQASAKEFGTIDICITNTGGPPATPFLKTSDKQWLDAVNLTLMSAVRLSREVIPFMQKKQWGRIIHMCSYSVKNPIPHLVFSNSIRSAVVALSKTQADELAPYGILVNAILPGWTATEHVKELLGAKEQNDQIQQKIPLKRMANPIEIAKPVVFLASEAASFITGTTLTIDGGETRFPF